MAMEAIEESFSPSESRPPMAQSALPVAQQFDDPQPDPCGWMKDETLVSNPPQHRNIPIFNKPTDEIQNEAQAALRVSNEDLQCRVAKLKDHAARLKRETHLLQRHLKDYDHPLFETWEADTITRLIVVASLYQPTTLDTGLINSLNTKIQHDLATRAYVQASKQITKTTLCHLGLSKAHHRAIMRYEHIAVYRSADHTESEVPFAQWLIQEKESRPDKYKFWSAIYPVCYGCSVETSANLV
ncbi:hypothetical protein PDE_08682 [Penicillium oxalicum 114-2]|uniref:Uncharacterized protein n=1 Tax=Penicillium oxalicum (strain 114-2 / CGMCC 5302) TaxID=933388 RepID=S7ZSN4_PENO1|nr:hypothetical protein PDE_08682 [Penicillium oxalicum 114-2]